MVTVISSAPPGANTFNCLNVSILLNRNNKNIKYLEKLVYASVELPIKNDAEQ